jgi:hypothetical protein
LILRQETLSPMAIKSKKPHSIRLSEAPEFFAPKALIVRRDAARLQALVLRESNISQDRAETMKGMFKTVGASLDHLRSRQEPIWEMQGRLAKKLADGKLVASGYRTKPTVSTSAESVPAILFSDSCGISWHENAVEAAGQRFELITVTKPPIGALDIETLAAPQKLAPKSRPGRPSKIELINEIIDELQNSGVQLNSKPRGVARDLIIEAAIKTGCSKNADGFSEPVIQRALFRKFGQRN